MSVINRFPVESYALPIVAHDGAKAELIVLAPEKSPGDVMFWVPAMGVPAKHYLPLAQGLAGRGVAVALHEWRGIGSSDQRAGYDCNWAYRELLDADLPASMAKVRERWPHARIWLGGHSLGGQLACLYAALHPHEFAGIALVASGAPYWRSFRWNRIVALSFLLAPMLAKVVGHLPGRRLTFAGNEARGVIDDWARTGRTGRYTVKNMPVNVEQRLASLQIPVLALRMREDWLGPAPSVEWLLGKMPLAPHQHDVISRDDMDGQPADHFTWMKYPQAVVARLSSWMAFHGGLEAMP